MHKHKVGYIWSEAVGWVVQRKHRQNRSLPWLNSNRDVCCPLRIPPTFSWTAWAKCPQVFFERLGVKCRFTVASSWSTWLRCSPFPRDREWPAPHSHHGSRSGEAGWHGVLAAPPWRRRSCSDTGSLCNYTLHWVEDEHNCCRIFHLIKKEHRFILLFFP